MTADELEEQLETAADSIKGLSKGRRVIAIHAETRMEAWTFLAQAHSDPKSSMLSKRLSQGFALGRKYRVDYVVGGPYPALSDQVLVNALTLQRGNDLRGLRIVLLSKAPPSDDLREAAERANAKIFHRKFP